MFDELYRSSFSVYITVKYVLLEILGDSLVQCKVANKFIAFGSNDDNSTEIEQNAKFISQITVEKHPRQDQISCKASNSLIVSIYEYLEIRNGSIVDRNDTIRLCDNEKDAEIIKDEKICSTYSILLPGSCCEFKIHFFFLDLIFSFFYSPRNTRLHYD